MATKRTPALLVKATTREQWLQDATKTFRKHFNIRGWTIPDNVRVSCGLPSGRAFSAKKRTIGEAWASTCSKDQHFEIFVSPTIDDPLQVLATLAHELVHTTVGLNAGHKGKFIKAAGDIGLQGPWTSTTATDDMAKQLQTMIDRLGPYPHASLDKMTNGKKKQSTRLVKCSCAYCGYTIRSTMKWILTAVPTCPDDTCGNYGKQMDVDLPEEDQALLNPDDDLDKGEPL